MSLGDTALFRQTLLVPSPGMKLLLVTLYWPPAGGGGVQRPLKFAQYLPALGIETHVLAPDDSKWIHEDADLRVPTQAWVHRARYLGPKGRRPAEELHGKEGLGRALVQREARGAPAARPGRERELEPDCDPGRDPDREEGGDRCRRDHLAPELPPPRRRGGEEGDRRDVGRRPARLARRPPAPACREHRGAREGEGRPRRRASRGPLRRRDHLRLRRDRRRGARLLAEGEGRDDLERLRLRRLRWARLRPRRPVPDHAHRQLLRQARPAPVPDGARRVRSRHRRPLPRRLPFRRPGVGRRTRASATSSS